MFVNHDEQRIYFIVGDIEPKSFESLESIIECSQLDVDA